jgi:inner membrane protease subunit 1
MLPTMDLTPNIFLAEKISTRFGKVAHWDIVVHRSPQNPRKIFTKRLVGLEGDTITYVSDPDNDDKHETVVVWSISY